MKQLSTYIFITLMVVCGLANSALAASAKTIEFRTEVKKIQWVKNRKGKKVKQEVDPGKVVPGAELVYTIYFKNTGDKAVGDIVITDPIPKHMHYKKGSAFGAGTDISFSVDGGKSYTTPDKLRVKIKGAKSRQAKPEDYTHIRWVFKPKLAPGKQGVVHFRSILQ